MAPTVQQLEEFKVKLEAYLAQHHKDAKNVGDPPKITLMQGSKFVRIVVSRHAGDRSCYGFIDKNNGDLLKSAGWAAPAKHARGSIFSQNPLAGCGPYGMAYLK